MASQTKKKPSAANKKTGVGGKGRPKPTGSRQSAKARQAEEERRLKRAGQRDGVLLLFLAAFLFCLAVVPGQSLWSAIQGFLLGVFGWCVFLWIGLLIYFAVLLFLRRVQKPQVVRGVQLALFILLLSSALHILSHDTVGMGWAEDLKDAYALGFGGVGGGAVGAMLGGILLFFGKAPAAVTVILLMLVDLTLLCWPMIAERLQEREENPRPPRASRIRQPEEKQEDLPEPMREVLLPPQQERHRRKRRKSGFDPDIPLDVPGATAPLPDLPPELLFGAMGAEREKALPAVDVPVMDLEPEEVELEPQVSEKAPQPSFALDDIIRKAAKPAAPAPARAEPEPRARENGADYALPPYDCLEQPKPTDSFNYSEELKANARKLVDTLKSFGVETKIVEISRGPAVTRYELQPSAGVRINRISNLADDIALNLAASGVRIEAPIPNKAAVGIEIPNRTRTMVTLREIIETPAFQQAKSKLNVALGKDIAGNITCADLAKMPHLLIAGTTGSGKSVCLNSMIVSILYNARPDEVKLLMIDPKKVELSIYNGIPHLLVPVVSDPRKASGALGWAVTEMLNRYKLFADNNVRDMAGYNKLCKKDPDKNPLPSVVIFIDELSDLMMAAPNEVEDSICRLAQMARAAGMHLVIATQRPSVDVITGIIKANIPSRIALSVSSQVDSRTILDMSGAEKLLGNGDMLFSPVGTSKPVRIQGCFLSDDEVESVVEFIKGQEKAEYDDEVIQEIDRQAAAEKKKGGGAADAESDGDSDEMLPKAIEVVVEAQMASTTLLQRRLRLGYARAARLVDELESRGIVGPFEGSKPRKVLISKQQWLEMNAMSDDIPAVQDDGGLEE